LDRTGRGGILTENSEEKSLMLNLRRRAIADCLMAFLIIGPTAAFAAKQQPPKLPITRDKVRLILLDNCVIDEWRVRDVKDRIADQCKCASARVARQLTEADIKTFKDKLPRTGAPMWQAAMKYCLNPPKPKAPAAAKVDEPAKTDAAAGTPVATPAATDGAPTDSAATGSTGGAAPPPER
jgi:hypothetical protein